MENESSDLEELYTKWKFDDEQKEKGRLKPRQKKFEGMKVRASNLEYFSHKNQNYITVENDSHLDKTQKILLCRLMDVVVPKNDIGNLTIPELEDLVKHTNIEFSKKGSVVTLRLIADNANERDIVVVGKFNIIYKKYREYK